jgi:hypothetical protein
MAVTSSIASLVVLALYGTRFGASAKDQSDAVVTVPGKNLILNVSQSQNTPSTNSLQPRPLYYCFEGRFVGRTEPYV